MSTISNVYLGSGGVQVPGSWQSDGLVSLTLVSQHHVAADLMQCFKSMRLCSEIGRWANELPVSNPFPSMVSCSWDELHAFGTRLARQF